MNTEKKIRDIYNELYHIELVLWVLIAYSLFTSSIILTLIKIILLILECRVLSKGEKYNKKFEYVITLIYIQFILYGMQVLDIFLSDTTFIDLLSIIIGILILLCKLIISKAILDFAISTRDKTLTNVAKFTIPLLEVLIVIYSFYNLICSSLVNYIYSACHLYNFEFLLTLQRLFVSNSINLTYGICYLLITILSTLLIRIASTGNSKIKEETK